MDLESKMGRNKIVSDNSTVRFPEGTFVRIDKVLIGREGKSDFIRAAVLALLEHREFNRRLSGGDADRTGSAPA